MIEHKLLCGCVIEVYAYHDCVDDLVGIDDMTILEQCDMHSGKQRIAELEKSLDVRDESLADQHKTIDKLEQRNKELEKELEDMKEWLQKISYTPPPPPFEEGVW